MIRFESPTKENPFGKLICEITNNISDRFQPPFKFIVTNTVDNKIKWYTELSIGWWSCYVEPCNSEAKLVDSNDELIDIWIWKTDKHGDFSHKIFLEWVLSNKNAKGIAVGTHDGSTGEWVYPLRENLIEGYLVEASEKQFLDLSDNYKEYKNAFVINSLITSDGSELEFFESDDGFTNSVSKEHVLKYDSNVRSILKKSISLNDLIIKCGLQNDLAWLHLDVEGIDDELILSLDDSIVKMPEIIIYESLNLSEERKIKVISFLESKNYTCVESGWNTIATLNKLDLSLLVHTCDNYERFWAGMLYTLDFYWNYDRIPVYFANEEKQISDIKFNCKGIECLPDRRIKQILTGKSLDKTGFSTRFIEALKHIPTKYVLYMQEDMWLKRSIDYKIFEELIDFMEKYNADSVRIHAKLFYYDTYVLEPTEHFIDGKRIFKNVGEHVLSHNATIWRKDYLLKYQMPGEDAWVNEIEGSKRMSKDNNNNYHYNIHWYCQPGISDKGDFSQEGIVYGHIVDEMKNLELKYK